MCVLETKLCFLYVGGCLRITLHIYVYPRGVEMWVWSDVHFFQLETEREGIERRKGRGTH